MLLHVRRARGAEALRRLAVHGHADQGRCGLRHVGRHPQACVLDVVEERLRVWVVEGRQPREHVEEQHPEVVDVHGVAVAAPQQDLGREEGHGATEGVGAAGARHALLGEPKVSEDGMSLLIEHHVVGLQIPEDNLPLVQVAERQEDLRGVQAREGLLQLLLAEDELLQVATRAELHHQHEVARRLEGVVQRDNVGVADIRQDVALCHGIAEEVAAPDPALLEDLHGVHLRRALVLHLEDLTEGAPAHELHELEGVRAHVFAVWARAPHTCEGRPHLRRVLAGAAARGRWR
mmetsp:Transcript_98719/g.308056  ORF Transcript_98719/g.308056 Transcript_98719/m.308056 type:complete len:291 (-) Transcript_98719:633-1505(-)